jgi:hypothetical protein
MGDIASMAVLVDLLYKLVFANPRKEGCASPPPTVVSKFHRELDSAMVIREFFATKMIFPAKTSPRQRSSKLQRQIASFEVLGKSFPLYLRSGAPKFHRNVMLLFYTVSRDHRLCGKTNSFFFVFWLLRLRFHSMYSPTCDIKFSLSVVLCALR